MGEMCLSEPASIKSPSAQHLSSDARPSEGQSGNANHVKGARHKGTSADV